MENIVFWDVTLCGSCKNQRFEGTYILHYQRARNNVKLLCVVPSSLVVSTLMTEAVQSQEFYHL
jgi:hypothetical protein